MSEEKENVQIRVCHVAILLVLQHVQLLSTSTRALLLFFRQLRLSRISYSLMTMRITYNETNANWLSE